MFLTKDELTTATYQYILDEITDNDDSIIEFGINSAIEEVKSYLTPNNQHQWMDGRPMYNADAIFNATATDRNSLILQTTKTVAIWHIIQLCNADVIYEQQKSNYDRAIDYLKQLASGKVTISSLPKLDPLTESPANREPIRWGSRKKFNHEF